VETPGRRILRAPAPPPTSTPGPTGTTSVPRAWPDRRSPHTCKRHRSPLHVCPRCAYSLRTEASAMPSCPARDSTTGQGTASGSVKNRPRPAPWPAEQRIPDGYASPGGGRQPTDRHHPASKSVSGPPAIPHRGIGRTRRPAHHLENRPPCHQFNSHLIPYREFPYRSSSDPITWRSTALPRP
jgi:hypothetical protein